jgi:hypothetical protein
MQSVFAIGDPEGATDEMLTAISVEKHRQLRRATQRTRRANQDTSERDLIQENDNSARRKARDLLPDGDRERLRSNNTAAHVVARTMGVHASQTDRWWDRVSQLNSSQVSKLLGLQWNRVCRHCGIKVRG